MKFEWCYWYPAGKPTKIGFRWKWREGGDWHVWLWDR